MKIIKILTLVYLVCKFVRYVMSILNKYLKHPLLPWHVWSLTN